LKALTVFGIDPGLSGAIAVYSPEMGRVREIADIPTLTMPLGKSQNRRVLDITGLNYLFSRLVLYQPEAIVLEKVGAFAGQAPGSMFSFGECYGALEVLCRQFLCKFYNPAPQEWKAHFRLKGKKAENATAETIAKAEQLMPDGAFRGPKGGLMDGRADAALLALYGSHLLNKSTR
jgi:hypothetical protein